MGMNTKQSTSKKAEYLYQLWIRKESEKQTFVYDTYLHQSSAIRAKSRLEGLYDCSCWIESISVEEYNAQLVRKVLKESHQKNTEEECCLFIDKNINRICASIHGLIKDKNMESEIKRKLLNGEALAYVEVMKVENNPLIESVILGARIACKRNHYEFTLGLKTKDYPYASKEIGIMLSFAYCETFQMLSEHLAEAVNPSTVKAILKNVIRYKLY